VRLRCLHAGGGEKAHLRRGGTRPPTVGEGPLDDALHRRHREGAAGGAALVDAAGGAVVGQLAGQGRARASACLSQLPRYERKCPSSLTFHSEDDAAESSRIQPMSCETSSLRKVASSANTTPLRP
jgi:hypothetical protein